MPYYNTFIYLIISYIVPQDRYCYPHFTSEVNKMSLRLRGVVSCPRSHISLVTEPI